MISEHQTNGFQCSVVFLYASWRVVTSYSTPFPTVFMYHYIPLHPYNSINTYLLFTMYHHVKVLNIYSNSIKPLHHVCCCPVKTLINFPCTKTWKPISPRSLASHQIQMHNIFICFHMHWLVVQ